MNNRRFILHNLFRAVLWLVGFLFIYVFFKRFLNLDFLVVRFKPLFDNEVLMYVIFLFSEIVVGIIPPEIFMIWALRFTDFSHYSLVVFSLSLISYCAGVLGYFIGRYLNTTLFYRYLRIRFLKKMENRLHSFGLYLIILASITPIPFSGVAMLTGSIRYSLQKYLLFSLFRFLRFGIYALAFWKVQALA